MIKRQLVLTNPKLR